MSKRRRAREMAVQMLYQRDLGGSTIAEVVGRFEPAEYAGAAPVGSDPQSRQPHSKDPDRPDPDPRTEGRGEPDYRGVAFEHARELVRGTTAHLEEIDALIVAQADNWRLERMSPVDRNILRLAVYEFLYQADVPKLVVIDEAIELAKRFGSENSSSFVNGVLDGMLKEHTFPGTLT